MGRSHVATAAAGGLALALGGLLMDYVGSQAGIENGPVAAMWLAVLLLGVGALLLIPVDEDHRALDDGDGVVVAAQPEVEPTR